MCYEFHPPTGEESEAQILIHEGRDGSGVLHVHLDEAMAEAAAQLAPHVAVRLWIQDVGDGDDAVAQRFGFEPYRDLWQLRCDLPVEEPSRIETVPYTGDELGDLWEVNQRAFHWHPEQGDRTERYLRERTAEAGMSPDGIRLHYRDGRLAGFCWTKNHENHDPPLGEIYVIAVDPDFQAQGLGRPMTLAGLEWLSGQGLTVGMLYVESDNQRANAVYRRIGFRHHHTNRAYRR